MKFKYFTINYVFFKLSKNINFLSIHSLCLKYKHNNYNIIFPFYKIYFSRSILRNLAFFSIIIKNKVVQFLHSISKTKINVFVINFNETTIIVKHNKKKINTNYNNNIKVCNSELMCFKEKILFFKIFLDKKNI